MKILRYKECDDKASYIEKIKECDWVAAQFLADILKQNRFDEILGGGELFLITDEDRLVSFCTLTKNDCIDAPTLFPWIGFLFTQEEYRGRGFAGQIIEAACSEARERGYDGVYIATDHIGFYERYGFNFIESRIDIYGEDSRIYYKKIKGS